MSHLIPVACSLDAGQTRRRAAEWFGLAGSVLGTESTEQRLTVRFATVAKDDLARLVDAERQCCSFANWDLAEVGEEVILTVTGDELGISALAQSFSLWGLAS